MRNTSPGTRLKNLMGIMGIGLEITFLKIYDHCLRASDKMGKLVKFGIRKFEYKQKDFDCGTIAAKPTNNIFSIKISKYFQRYFFVMLILRFRLRNKSLR